MHQAPFDSLTGLANRRHFLLALETALAAARSAASTLGVMYIDLDRFKSINDSYGHAAGDELLRIVAHRLRQRLRGSDVVKTAAQPWLARLGGDEFAVLLPNVGELDDATSVATRLLAVLSEPVILEGKQGSGTRRASASRSIRITAPTSSRMLRAADARSTERRRHRGGCRDLRARAARPRAAPGRRRSQLREALASARSTIHYQPKYSPRRPQAERRRSPAALGRPRARPGGAARVHPGRGGNRPDLAARRVGPRAVCSRPRALVRRGSRDPADLVQRLEQQFVESEMLQVVTDVLTRIRSTLTGSRSSSPRARSSRTTSGRRPACGRSGPSACESRSTISAPATRRSAT